ncbi:MAG: DUF3800 domain-containing protein [Phycisphaerales bacterium]|jgi:hypothetical protein|nr:DUF3800 domain-containing protein [Phycisphaerales bacterium]
MEQPEDTIAFVDEFGTPSLNTEKDGVTNLFICVAVLLRPDDRAIASEKIDQIRTDHFNNAEIRSNRIRGRRAVDRRLRLLDAIADIPFAYYALVVDKRSIHRDSGLSYKRSFYKYFHKLLCRRLTAAGMGISIVADRLGDLKFMEGFVEYVNKNIKPDLFNTFEFSFDDWQNEPLLQLADLVAGTLGKIHDPDHETEATDAFRRSLSEKRIAELVWPPYWTRSNALDEMQEPDSSRWDSEISRACLAKVRNFMQSQPDGDPDIFEMQRMVLDRLLQQRILGSEGKESVYLDKLLGMLQGAGFSDLHKQTLSSKVIGGLRDKGFILAGTSAGYRMAMTWADIGDYLNHTNNVIGPMLSRLAHAQETIKMATHNDLNILGSTEHAWLGRLLDCDDHG